MRNQLSAGAMVLLFTAGRLGSTRGEVSISVPKLAVAVAAAEAAVAVALVATFPLYHPTTGRH